MGIKIGNYGFDGPFSSTDSLMSQSGVYSILGRHDELQRWTVMDIGEAGLSDSLNDKAVAIATDRLDAHGRAAIWFYLSRLAIVAHHVAAIDAIHDPAR